MWTFGRYYRENAMYFVPSLSAFLPVYNDIHTIITCEYSDCDPRNIHAHMLLAIKLDQDYCNKTHY